MNNTNQTWSFTPKALPSASGSIYSITTNVVDAAGNFAPAGGLRRFSLDNTSNQLNGTAAANTLTATGAKDLLTGLGSSDTFSFPSLNKSLLESFDRITDFAIGIDLLKRPGSTTPASVNMLGTVVALDAQSISDVLTFDSFLPNSAASFTYGDPSGITRTFVALNDSIAGYSTISDAVIEITGYTGQRDQLLVS